MRKESGKGFLPALLCAALLLTQLFLGAAMAEELELMPMTQVVLPGKGTVIRFTLAEAAACDLMLLDGEGRTLCMIAKNLEKTLFTGSEPGREPRRLKEPGACAWRRRESAQKPR